MTVYCRKFYLNCVSRKAKRVFEKPHHWIISPISDPRGVIACETFCERLAQLMIAACLAYIWIIYLGVMAMQEDFYKIIHRTDRCDCGDIAVQSFRVSLFQMGLRLLDYFLNQEMEIPVAFNRVE